jgi:hypothetical protein
MILRRDPPDNQNLCTIMELQPRQTSTGGGDSKTREPSCRMGSDSLVSWPYNPGAGGEDGVDAEAKEDEAGHAGDP